MSLVIAPIEQVAAELLAGLIIPQGQNGVAANIVKRANTALAVSAVLTELATGDAQSALASFQGLLADPTLDPAVVLAIQNMITIGFQQVSFLANLNKALPLFGITATAVITNVAAGVTAAANAEIAKYGTPAVAAA